MKKRFTRILAAFALLVFMAPCMAGWGQTSSSVSSLIFTAKCNGTGTADDGAMYTVSSDANESSFDDTKGIHYGTGSAAVSYLNLSTSGISGTITKIVVNASGASGTSAKLNVTVGGSAFGTQKSLTSTATAYTFEGSASGSISVAITQTSAKKALYCKSIVVTYTPSSGPVTLTAPTLTATPGNGQVSVSWNAVSNASSYTLCWANNASFTDATEIGDATSPKVIGNLTNGTTYYFKAKSIGDGTSYNSSDYGNAVNATPAIPQLAQPVLTVTYGNALATPTWTADANAISYTLQYATNSDFTTGLQTIENAISNTAITGLTNDVAYYFRLQAIGDGTSYTTSEWSEAVTVTPSTLITDVLTHVIVNAAMAGTSGYQEWANVSIITDARYAGKSNYSTSYIQINKTNPSGIVSTTSGGKVKKVSVTFNSATISGRFITVYGKNTPYESSADLYDENKMGSSLGTIKYGTNTELEINGDYYYVGLKANDALYVEPINISWLPVESYNVNISTTNGTITANPSSAFEGMTIALSATANDNYRFDGYTVTNATTGEAISVSNTGTFTMPASAVYVTGTFTRLYTVTVLGEDITGGTVTASPLQAAEGEEITLTAEPAQHYEFNGDDDWLVMYGEESETVTVENNKFNMPAADVDVLAYFTRKTYTITYSVNGNEHAIAPAQVLGGNSIETFPANPVYGDYSFLGWAQTEGGTDYVPTSYVPTSDMTLYAVFGTTSSQELTITPSNSGLTNSYYSGEKTIGSKKFQCTELCTQNPNSNLVIQFKKSSGALYNKTDFGAIYSMVITYYSGTSYKDISVKAGASQNPTSADAIVASIDGDVYTYTFPDNCNYFLLSNGSSGASQVSSIQINYEATSPVVMTVTRITDAQTRSESIPATEFVIVKDGGVLTLTAANNGDASNLIIEEGGQLITSIVVAGTVQKNITAYTSDNDGWNLISSPVNNPLGASEIGLTTGTYDLYYLDEPTTKWINYKSSNGNSFSIQPQTGYLYANAANTTLSFSGTLQPNVEGIGCTVPLSKSGNGWNLVGNPFPFNAYVNKPYYVINGRTVKVYEGSDPVPTCTGIIVKATEANETVTFRRTAFTDGAVNNGNIQMTLAQQATNRGTATTVDNAIVSFNEGSQLEKFYFGTQNANLYIPQGTEEYAIASSNSQGEMPVNFKANEDGQYTLTVNPENVEMGYLHLIDNMTGADIDLLALRQAQGPASYTFNAKTTDYESRFRLVFAANSNTNDNSEEASFAFFSNGSWIINNPSTGSGTGEATLQVIDINGRILSSETINGSVSKSINATTGIYMMRLISGDNVKTQKVVVR